MNRVELLDLVDFILDNNDGQISQAYSDARKQQALNLAYQHEVNTARLEGKWLWSKSTKDIVWPADQVVLPLAADVAQQGIIALRDVTHSDPGVELVLSSDQDTARPFWKDRQALQWGSNGPSEEKTIRFVYWPILAKLAADGDIPVLIPPDHHEVLAWGAVEWLTLVGDQDEIPGRWLQRLNDLRMNLYKYVSLNRPAERANTVSMRPGDNDDFSY